MVYGRCLVCGLIIADSQSRMAYKITRREVGDYIKHACVVLRSELLKANIGNGKVSFLVDLDMGISISEFLSEFKSMTSAWITGINGNQDYWSECDYKYEVSYEDRDAVMAQLESQDEAFVQFNHPTACYHIILLTSRARLLIPIKHRRLLADIIKEVAQSEGANAIISAAMRNHAHLLCGVRKNISISQFIENIRIKITENILSNRHLRRIEELSDEAIAYTVSANRISQEECHILDQDFIHSRSHLMNEMSPLYQKLNIPYVVSLR